MCESLKENGGKCCGECERVESIQCACGTILDKDEEIKCFNCSDVVCENCGTADYYDVGISICKRIECEHAAVELIVAKLEAAEKQTNEATQRIIILETQFEVAKELRGSNIDFLCKRAKKAETKLEAAANALGEINKKTAPDISMDWAAITSSVHYISDRAVRAIKK